MSRPWIAVTTSAIGTARTFADSTTPEPSASPVRVAAGAPWDGRDRPSDLVLWLNATPSPARVDPILLPDGTRNAVGSGPEGLAGPSGDDPAGRG